MAQRSGSGVTTLNFHTGVADKLGYTCRLLRKAWRAGNRVLVSGDGAELARLDGLLWTFDEADFVPHAYWQGDAAMAQRLALTPIWLLDDGLATPADLGEFAVRVNLGPTAVADVLAHLRLIEVVSDRADEAAAGRLRWRHYLQAGYQPVNHAQGES